jgi:hypothetical protein
MRILSLALFLGVIAVASPALADATAAPGQCIDYHGGACGCDEQTLCSAPAPDLAVPFTVHDMSTHDLASPPDACLERVRKQKRAHGRGLVLLSGLSVLAVIGLRRRYRTSRPTPAENALAAKATRKDS